MNKKAKKNFIPGLIIGTVMILLGSGGIGYIPGKSVMFSLISIVISLAGISLVFIYIAMNKSYKRRIQTYSRRKQSFPGQSRKSNSQFAA